MKIRIYYEDTDAAGIVYYANYLKFCERARSEIFFEAAMSPQSDDGYFVVKDLEAKYLEPARLGELLEVQTLLAERKSASVVLCQSIWREDRLLFEMRIRLAFLKEGKPKRIPPSILRLFSRWEEDQGES